MSDAKPAPPADDPNAKTMPLLDHLLELRRRLILSLGGMAVAIIGCFFVADALFIFLAEPCLSAGCERMIVSSPQEKFFVNLKIAFFSGAFVAFPLVATQIWLFVAPGLYRNEKQAFLPFLVATPFLFFLGGAFVRFIVVPMALGFFVSFAEGGSGGGITVEVLPRTAEYLDFVMALMFAFGLAFQLPVLLTLLVRVGIASVAGLTKFRRYAIVLAFVLAAILTPPDPLSQIGLAIPLCLLYEASIWIGRLIARERAAVAVGEPG